MTGYLRNQRRKGYPRQGVYGRTAHQFRILAGAAGDAASSMRDLSAAFQSVGWYGTDDPRNDPADTYPGRYA